MSAQPNCIICRGAGVAKDSAGRDEVCACTNYEPPKPFEYKPPEKNWAGEALSDIFRRQEQRRKEFEEHRASCGERPCKRCERFVCSCGRPFDGAGNFRCRDCWRAEREAEALKPFVESIPRRFRWAFEPAAELRARVKASPEFIASWVSNPPSEDLVLFGDTAAGKTSLIVAMLNSWVRKEPERRAGARFIEAYWLAGGRSRHPLGEGEAPIVLNAMYAPLVVIDDLGSEATTHHEVIKSVIFKRHNEMLPTWITTGFQPQQLMDRYGSQVLRRIIEQGKKATLGAKS